KELEKSIVESQKQKSAVISAFISSDRKIQSMQKSALEAHLKSLIDSKGQRMRAQQLQERILKAEKENRDKTQKDGLFGDVRSTVKEQLGTQGLNFENDRKILN